MKIAIASDHAGFRYKELVKSYLISKGLEVSDFGTGSEDPCDYPDFVIPAAKALRDGQVPALVPALEEMLVLGDVVRKAGHAGFVELQPLAVGVSQPPHLLDGVAV